MIIGLTGRKRSGKSTLAHLLMERHGFVELSFAARLKKMAVDVNPLVHYIDALSLTETDRELLANGVEPGPVHLLDALGALGEERAKDLLPEVRRFYQRLGTEGVRNNLGEDTWVEVVNRQICGRYTAYARAGLPTPRIVLADVRFENEADLIRRWGGLVVEVRRPALDASTPADDHASEAGVRADFAVTHVEGEPEHAFTTLEILAALAD